MLRALLHSHPLPPAQWLLGEGNGSAGLHEDKGTQVPTRYLSPGQALLFLSLRLRMVERGQILKLLLPTGK